MLTFISHRVGPNGRRTLCNRCGLRWAREQREKEREEEAQRKRKIDEIIVVVPQASKPAAAAPPKRHAPSPDKEAK